MGNEEEGKGNKLSGFAQVCKANLLYMEGEGTVSQIDVSAGAQEDDH